jgi:hypothetical protein
MRALTLDYQRPARSLPGLGVVVLAAALAAFFLLGSYYRDLVEQGDLLEARRDRLQRQAHHAPPAPRLLDVKAEQAQNQEMRQANLVLRQLRMPWKALFSAVEDSAGKDVALLEMEPDSRNGTVKITGEAKQLDAVLKFVKALEAHAVFSSVFLQNHQVRERDPQRPLRFSLLASWKVDKP